MWVVAGGYSPAMAERIERDLLPEDAYDAGDPLGDRIRLAGRIVNDVLADPDTGSRTRRRRDVLQLLDRLGDEVLTLMDLVSEARARMEGGE